MRTLNKILSPLQSRNLQLTAAGQDFYPWNPSHAAPCPQGGERHREKKPCKVARSLPQASCGPCQSQLYTTGFGGRIVRAKKKRWELDIPIDLIHGEGSHKLPSLPCLGSACDSALVGNPMGFWCKGIKPSESSICQRAVWGGTSPLRETWPDWKNQAVDFDR